MKFHSTGKEKKKEKKKNPKRCLKEWAHAKDGLEVRISPDFWKTILRVERQAKNALKSERWWYLN